MAAAAAQNPPEPVHKEAAGGDPGMDFDHVLDVR